MLGLSRNYRVAVSNNIVCTAFNMFYDGVVAPIYKHRFQGKRFYLERFGRVTPLNTV